MLILQNVLCQLVNWKSNKFFTKTFQMKVYYYHLRSLYISVSYFIKYTFVKITHFNTKHVELVNSQNLKVIGSNNLFN